MLVGRTYPATCCLQSQILSGKRGSHHWLPCYNSLYVSPIKAFHGRCPLVPSLNGASDTADDYKEVESSSLIPAVCEKQSMSSAENIIGLNREKAAMSDIHYLVLFDNNEVEHSVQKEKGLANTAKRNCPVLTCLFSPNTILVFFRKFWNISSLIRSLGQKSCTPKKILFVFEAMVGAKLIRHAVKFVLRKTEQGVLDP